MYRFAKSSKKDKKKKEKKKQALVNPNIVMVNVVDMFWRLLWTAKMLIFILRKS